MYSPAKCGDFTVKDAMSRRDGVGQKLPMQRSVLLIARSWTQAVKLDVGEKSLENCETWTCERARCAVGPEDARWPMHSRGGYSYKRLRLAQLLGQLGVFLTWIV
jgi:hypothetical protein